MQVYLINKAINKVRIVKYHQLTDEQKMAKQVPLSPTHMPQPDCNDLIATIDKIIDEEGKRGNKVETSEICVLYPLQRYNELRKGAFIVENSDRIVTTEEQELAQAEANAIEDKQTEINPEQQAEVLNDSRKKEVQDWSSKYIINPRRMN